jgi:hypothetical protein
MTTLLVWLDGQVRCLYDETIDLASIGALHIRRASHVEPDSSGRWWTDLSPAGGPVLGPYPLRSEALTAEQQWLEHGFVTDCVLSCSRQELFAAPAAPSSLGWTLGT